jgi:hypothetical protein
MGVDLMPEVICDIFEQFDIFPNYYGGFSFGWLLKKDAEVPQPLVFTVQHSSSGLGDWKDISPEVAGYTWAEDCRNRKNKNSDLFYRVKAKFGENDDVCYSHVQNALGDQDLRAYIYTREIMRKEVLQMRNLAGVEVNIFKKVHETTEEAEKCLECRDPITDKIMDPTCEQCGGTGFKIGTSTNTPGWYGPFPAYATFSTRNIHKKHAQDGAFVEDDRGHKIRIVGSPLILRDDMIVDTTGNLRYIANVISNLTELRRIAVIQEVTANELETSDVRYSTGV